MYVRRPSSTEDVRKRVQNNGNSAKNQTEEEPLELADIEIKRFFSVVK